MMELYGPCLFMKMQEVNINTTVHDTNNNKQFIYLKQENPLAIVLGREMSKLVPLCYILRANH